MKKAKLRHFESVQDAVDYGVSELFETLQYDLHRMTENPYERSHYTNADRRDMRDRVHDLEQCEYMLRNASHVDDMLFLLHRINRWYGAKKTNQTAERLLEDLRPRIEQIVTAMRGTA